MAGLLDYLQAASNAVASNVSGPVDLINAGLLGIGLPMPRNPVGGSQWMADRGLTREVRDPVARVAGETAGLLAPTMIAAKAPQIAQGMLSHADAYRKYHAATTAPGAPATVWHGSPHRFDKFDSSKIGTGEGAQAYGHGLYFAENPKVAQEYQRTLSKYATQIDGKPVLESYADGTLASQLASKAGLSRGDAVRASHWLGESARTNRQVSEIVEEDVALSLQLLGDTNEAARIRALGAKVAGVSQGGTAGHLYKVDIPDDAIARMLDWDAPLSKQPDTVRSAVSAIKKMPLDSDTARILADQGDALNAGSLYTLLGMDDRIGSRAAAAAVLRQQGIPGIRYLDGGSRAAGAGSRNYVVFPGNEGLLTILGRE